MGNIKEWKEVCGLPKTKQGMVLWLHLLRDTPSNIKDLTKSSVGVNKLKKEMVVNKIINAMNKPSSRRPRSQSWRYKPTSTWK